MGFAKKFKAEVESLCSEHLSKFPYVQQYLMHPGKLLRPKLYLEMVGSEQEKDYAIAAGIEILHLFFLVHDDIMDNDLKRRDIWTIHGYYGNQYGRLKGDGIGIVVGDLLFSRALKLLNENLNDSEARRVLFEVVDVTAQGQLDEYLLSPDKINSVQEILNYYEEKTALYSIYLPLALGYYEKTGENFRFDYLRKLRDFSKFLGVAFQVNDDLIEFNLEKLRLEEKVCSDVIRGKITPLLAFILEKAPADWKMELVKEWQTGNLSKASHDAVLEKGKELGVLEFARKLIDENANKAWKLANELGLSDLPTIEQLRNMLK